MPSLRCLPAFLLLALASASPSSLSSLSSTAPAPSLARAPNVLVVYSTETGHTKTLALAIADGARKGGAVVKTQAVKDTNFTTDVLEWADAILLGSPVHYGNPASELLAWVETDWEAGWTDPRFAFKTGAVFATGGGIAQGIEHVLASLTRILWSFRIRVVTPNPTRSGFSSYGAIGITGTPPYNQTGPGLAEGFISEGNALGADVAKEAAMLLSTCGTACSESGRAAAAARRGAEDAEARHRGWGYAT